jgi:hypothetical protein
MRDSGDFTDEEKSSSSPIELDKNTKERGSGKVYSNAKSVSFNVPVNNRSSQRRGRRNSIQDLMTGGGLVVVSPNGKENVDDDIDELSSFDNDEDDVLLDFYAPPPDKTRLSRNISNSAPTSTTEPVQVSSKSGSAFSKSTKPQLQKAVMEVKNINRFSRNKPRQIKDSQLTVFTDNYGRQPSTSHESDTNSPSKNIIPKNMKPRNIISMKNAADKIRTITVATGRQNKRGKVDGYEYTEDVINSLRYDGENDINQQDDSSPIKSTLFLPQRVKPKTKMTGTWKHAEARVKVINSLLAIQGHQNADQKRSALQSKPFSSFMKKSKEYKVMTSDIGAQGSEGKWVSNDSSMQIEEMENSDKKPNPKKFAEVSKFSFDFDFDDDVPKNMPEWEIEKALHGKVVVKKESSVFLDKLSEKKSGRAIVRKQESMAEKLTKLKRQGSTSFEQKRENSPGTSNTTTSITRGFIKKQYSLPDKPVERKKQDSLPTHPAIKRQNSSLAGELISTSMENVHPPVALQHSVSSLKGKRRGSFDATVSVLKNAEKLYQFGAPSHQIDDAMGMTNHIIVFGCVDNLKLFISELRRPLVENTPMYHNIIIAHSEVPPQWNSIQQLFKDVYLVITQVSTLSDLTLLSINTAHALVLLASREYISSIAEETPNIDAVTLFQYLKIEVHVPRTVFFTVEVMNPNNLGVLNSVILRSIRIENKRREDIEIRKNTIPLLSTIKHGISFGNPVPLIKGDITKNNMLEMLAKMQSDHFSLQAESGSNFSKQLSIGKFGRNIVGSRREVQPKTAPRHTFLKEITKSFSEEDVIAVETSDEIQEEDIEHFHDYFDIRNSVRALPVFAAGQAYSPSAFDTLLMQVCATKSY